MKPLRNFTDRDTEQLFRTENNRRFNEIARVALQKLIQINQASEGSSSPTGIRI
jgi:plasmid maintenance system killer protein